ncbi:hypothetical protein U5N28_03690 [Lysinibacillus telephonicus]|uniref:hypothetical protein n=1 Tax=Lysinibacillus telephonicus TaxID=1714840 RepID=UPI00163AF0D5|nr:hypothetical protein [Lysinibacillus telephonicus]
MKKEERLHEVNDQAALNNNLDAATLQMNTTIAKQHEKPKANKQISQKNNEKNIH